MIGLNTPVFANREWKLAKDIKAGDVITNSFGKLTEVKSVSYSEELSQSISLSNFPFPVILGVLTPIVSVNHQYVYMPKNMKTTMYSCDLPKKVDVNAKHYTTLGSVMFDSSADIYSVGYISGCNYFKGLIHESLYDRVVNNLENVPDELLSSLEDPNYRWSVNCPQFHRGFADAVKDRYTNLSIHRSNILICMDIAHAYSLGDRNIVWDSKITYLGRMTRSSSVVDVIKGNTSRRNLINIETDGGLIAAGLRLRNE